MLQMQQPRDMTSKSKLNTLTEGKSAQRTFFGQLATQEDSLYLHRSILSMLNFLN